MHFLFPPLPRLIVGGGEAAPLPFEVDAMNVYVMTRYVDSPCRGHVNAKGTGIHNATTILQD